MISNIDYDTLIKKWNSMSLKELNEEQDKLFKKIEILYETGQNRVSIESLKTVSENLEVYIINRFYT